MGRPEQEIIARNIVMNEQDENSSAGGWTTPNPTYQDHPQTSIMRQFRNTWPISVFGILLVLGGSYLLFWNEGRAIKTAMALEEGLREIIVPGTIEEVFPENDDKLVLVGGPLAMTNSLQDDYYRISMNAVKLKKTVEMFQWKETEHKKEHTVTNADGEQVTHVDKTYSYHTDWFDHHIDSSKFHNSYGYTNPPREYWPAESRTDTNSDVRIGSFVLGPALKDKITSFKPLPHYKLPTSAWA